ncbi:MAG: hypothetical protein V3575_02850, partial [Candidatus Absconditabacteria bacterium]
KKVSTQNVTVQYLSCDGTSHGQTKSFYQESSVAFGQSCDAHQKKFKCENGAWKDGSSNADLELYKYFSCTVGPASNCETDTNTQKSTTNLDIVFSIPATNNGLGFEIDQTVNENNGTYKYTLQGTCNNGTLENIVLGSPLVQSCDSNFTQSENSCLDMTPPIGGDFNINGGDENTSSVTVSLNITCPVDEAGSNPVQVAFGNEPNPTNWESCTTTKSHTLTNGDGTKTVYMRFRDSTSSHNLTTTITKSINLVALPRLSFDINSKNLNQGNMITNKYLWIVYHSNKCMFQCNYCDWCNGGLGSWGCQFSSGWGSGCPTLIGNVGEYDVNSQSYTPGSSLTYRCFESKVQANNGGGWVTQNLSSTGLSMDCFSEN